MSILRLSPFGRFDPRKLFAPGSVAVVGAASKAGGLAIANLLAGGFKGAVLPVAATQSVSGVLAYPTIAALPIAPDLAVIAADAPIAACGPILAELAARGTFAAIVLTPAGGIGAGRALGMRVMGPSAFGLCVPALGLNASRAHLVPRPGRLALVSQSGSLCRAILDWAEPNGVGFSHIAGLGRAADLGFSEVLDWLGHDPNAGAILLDIRLIRNPRAFLSAARAAARTRPVVAIRAGGLASDPSGAADAAMESALRRSGVLSVHSLTDLLAAAETLSRARPARSERLAIVTNARGPGLLAADAARREGLHLAELSDATCSVLRLTLPDVACGAHPIQVPDAAPIRLAETAAMLAGAPEIGGVLVVHAPMAAQDEAGMAALVACQSTSPIPLLVCAMGETTGAARRQRLAEAGLPVFATPEQAVRGFLHLVQDRRNRAAARELPPGEVMTVAPDRARAAAILAKEPVSGQDAGEALSAYGIAAGDADDLHIAVGDDAMFGPVITLRRGDADADAGWGWGVDLPPLNLPLARALILRARIAPARPALDRLAETLVRVSQLVVDFPGIASLAIEGRAAPSIVMRAPDAPPGRLAIAPYPAELEQPWRAPDGTKLTIRPIRPEDAEAHFGLFSRLSPDDVRRRFFSAMRSLSPEQTARMTQVDYDREMAFVAVRGDQTVGVSRLVIEPGTPRAEFAIVVQPDMKGQGLARHLMRRLIDWAASRGVTEIVGQVLADNKPMLAFARSLGMAIHRIAGEDEVVEARLTVP